MKKNTLTVCIVLIFILTALYSFSVLKDDRLLFLEDLIFPVVCILLCIVIFFLKIIPDKIKNTIIIVLSLIFVLRIVLLGISGSTIHFKTYYDKDAVKIYYDIEEEIIFDYEECRAYSYEANTLFQQSAKTVIFKTGDNFEKAKKSISENYKFYSEPLNKNEPQPHFEFSGYNFKLQCIEKVYPKVILFVGMNERSKEIAYVYFNDVNLDTVLNFEDILQFYCGWQYIELYEDGKILGNLVLL